MKGRRALGIAVILVAICVAYVLGYRRGSDGSTVPKEQELSGAMPWQMDKSSGTDMGENTAGGDSRTGAEEKTDFGDGREEAEEVTDGGTQTNYRYDVLPEDNSVVILAYLGNESVVFVPEKLEGWTVSTIGEGAFNGNESIEQVVLPAGIVEIESEAFADCPKLQYVFMAQGIKEIESYAFAYCPSLVEIRFPEGLEYIQGGVCQDCLQLERVTIPQSVKGIKTSAFDGCASLKLIYGSSQFAEIYAQRKGLVYVDINRIEDEGSLVW